MPSTSRRTTKTGAATSRPYRGETLDERRHGQRERILDAARHVFARRGYADTNLEDIVTRAKVSRTSFYEFFANKEECFLAVFNAGMERMAQAVLAAAGQRLAPYDRIRAEVAAVASTFAADPDTARIIMIEAVSATAGSLSAGVSARQAMAAVIEDQLAGYPVWAARSKRDREIVSRAAMAAIVESLSQLCAEGRLDEWEQVVEPVTALIAHGLIPPT